MWSGAPAPELPEEDRRWVALIGELWQTLRERCAELPQHAAWRLLLDFDYRQVFNAMRCGLLLHHHPTLINLQEHSLYQPHNMNMMVFGTLDLMIAPSIPDHEVGALRAFLWKAQCMGQISNMTVTWEREIPDRDFTSLLFALALAQGLLSAQELRSLPPEQIAEKIRAAGIEDQLLSEWRALDREICEMARNVPAVDVERLLEGLHALLGMTLASRWLI